MKRFKNILVVYDSKTDNQALFNQAVDLAQNNQASVMVIDVIEDISPVPAKEIRNQLADDTHKSKFHIIEGLSTENLFPPNPGVPVEDEKNMVSSIEEPSINIMEYIKQVEEANLQQFVLQFQRAGVKVNSKTILGIPFIKIIQEVLQNHYDLVMITAEGQEGVKEALFGNTTMHLMRKCPCPIWVIKPGQPAYYNRILAAVDLFQNDHERVALAKKIMELATSLARSRQSELLIMHSWSLFGESVLRGRGGISNEAIEKIRKETRDEHLQWLTELIQQHPMDDLKTSVYLLQGDAGTLINNLAQVRDVDLIIMGTVSRGGLSGLFIGNTAEKVLRQANCSMLTVKPDGFISPVKLEQG